MGKFKIYECTGYSREEAFADLGYDPDRPSVKGTNCTQMWRKEGCPMPGTVEFKRFAVEQLGMKTRNEEGVGLFIVINPPTPDIRKRPFTLVNYKAETSRSWHIVYQIREDVLNLTEFEAFADEDEIENVPISILSTGVVVEECESKGEAIKVAKDWTSKTKKSYSIVVVKKPDYLPIAAHVVYTPSQNAKKGKWITFGFLRDSES